jgi:hypothetical protein
MAYSGSDSTLDECAPHAASFLDGLNAAEAADSSLSGSEGGCTVLPHSIWPVSAASHLLLCTLVGLSLSAQATFAHDEPVLDVSGLAQSAASVD